jgi:hypothetical protein
MKALRIEKSEGQKTKEFTSSPKHPISTRIMNIAFTKEKTISSDEEFLFILGEICVF